MNEAHRGVPFSPRPHIWFDFGEMTEFLPLESTVEHAQALLKAGWGGVGV